MVLDPSVKPSQGHKLGMLGLVWQKIQESLTYDSCWDKFKTAKIIFKRLVSTSEKVIQTEKGLVNSSLSVAGVELNQNVQLA